MQPLRSGDVSRGSRPAYRPESAAAAERSGRGVGRSPAARAGPASGSAERPAQAVLPRAAWWWPARNETGRPGQPPGQPGRPAGPARPGRPPEAAHRQRALAALILGLVSVLSFFGVGTNFRRGIYLLIFALAVGVAAIWLGVTASRRARREGTMRPR